MSPEQGPCQICGAIETDEAHVRRARHKNHVAIASFVARGLVPLPCFVEQCVPRVVPESELHDSEAKSYGNEKASQGAWSKVPVLFCTTDLAEDLMFELREKQPNEASWNLHASRDLLARSIEAARLCANGVPWWHAWVRTSRLSPYFVEKTLRIGIDERDKRNANIFWEVFPWH